MALITEYIPRTELEHLLAALMPANRLALEISLHTGLRISDVLSLRTESLKKRMSVRELKTGKLRKISLTNELYERAMVMSGKHYVFESRLYNYKHRTRQAVFKDLKRVCDIFRLKINIAPHSARKVYAVEQYNRSGSLKHVQQLLNHRDPAVTMLYAMADDLTTKNHTKRVKKM